MTLGGDYLPQGGKREGAGRKQGSKVSNNTTTFFARCTEVEKDYLKKYLEQIRKTENKQ